MKVGFCGMHYVWGISVKVEIWKINGSGVVRLFIIGG